MDDNARYVTDRPENYDLVEEQYPLGLNQLGNESSFLYIFLKSRTLSMLLLHLLEYPFLLFLVCIDAIVMQLTVFARNVISLDFPFNSQQCSPVYKLYKYILLQLGFLVDVQMNELVSTHL